MRKPLFCDLLQVRVEPELREAVCEAARREKTTAAEWTRRALRELTRAAAEANASRSSSRCVIG
jgi:predicted HicB family RNase H-like nuclease